MTSVTKIPVTSVTLKFFRSTPHNPIIPKKKSRQKNLFSKAKCLLTSNNKLFKATPV